MPRLQMTCPVTLWKEYEGALCLQNLIPCHSTCVNVTEFTHISTALSQPMFTKRTNVQHNYLQNSYTDFHARWTITVVITSRTSLTLFRTAWLSLGRFLLKPQTFWKICEQLCIQFSQLSRAFLVLSSLFIYPTNTQLDCSKIMLKFTVIFTLKVLLHVSV